MRQRRIVVFRPVSFETQLYGVPATKHYLATQAQGKATLTFWLVDRSGIEPFHPMGTGRQAWN
jgi:hypothetical protein